MDNLRLKDLFRLDVSDNVSPYLWSDDEVFSYMDDAQKMFCRLTNGIADTSSSVCQVDIEAGEPFAKVDPKILLIRRMHRDSDGKQVEVVNVEDMDSLGLRLDDSEGRVDAVVVGLEEHTLRWVKVPSVDDSVSMTVFRLPLRDITSQKALLEIDERHHRHLLLWMKSLAYAKQDSDSYDQKKADLNESKFREYCRQAKLEQDKTRHKVRMVRYGGIGGSCGFFNVPRRSRY